MPASVLDPEHLSQYLGRVCPLVFTVCTLSKGEGLLRSCGRAPSPHVLGVLLLFNMHVSWGQGHVMLLPVFILLATVEAVGPLYTC